MSTNAKCQTPLMHFMKEIMKLLKATVVTMREYYDNRKGIKNT